jgi:DNA uptake protein ComE-like DNA-binding protein
MAAQRAFRFDFSWAQPDQVSLLILLLMGSTLLAIAAARGWVDTSELARFDSSRVEAASQKVDPNTASLASFRRLPDVGPLTSAAFIEYRQAASRQPQSRPLFLTPADLDSVPYLGPLTIEQFAPYLVFPSPATVPASRP